VVSGTYEKNLKRLREIADTHGLVLNPDEKRVKKVVGLMADNYDQVNEWVCPCKQTQRPAVKGEDEICPCNAWMEEINAEGHCRCRLFYAKEEAAEK